MDRKASEPAARAPRSGPGAALWLAAILTAMRLGLVVALELAHHGDARLARLRAGNAFPSTALVGLALALGGMLALAGRGAPGRLRRLAAVLALAAASWAFLVGRLAPDLSLRVGTDTARGLAVLGCAGVLALAAALLFVRFHPGRARAFDLVPLVLLAGAGLALRAGTGATGSLEFRSVDSDLVAGGWEVVRARPGEPPESGVVCPSARYRVDGAARPTLVLPPPACVRFRLEGPAGARTWLRGGIGRDHGAGAALQDPAPGRALRFRVRIDGQLAFERALDLATAETWIELGEGRGLEVPPGAELELETALLDGEGNEVVPAAPLAAGFGGLLLEHEESIARASASPARPSLVLVLLDTLRADRTSTYGYARPTTPNLDALARRGVVFGEVCATASWTWPSTASILTGLLPEQHGVQDAASSFLPEGLDTLAEALQREGFTTAAWSGSPLIVPDKHFDQGFEFFDASAEGRMRRSDIFLPSALEWLGSVGERRFFLYLHLMEPHAPFVPLEEGRRLFAPEVPLTFDPRKVLDYHWELLRDGFSPQGERRTDAIVPPQEQRWIGDLYDGCVWSADHYLGQILARLEELGLDASTIVAVTSDHGEELFDHGLLNHEHSLHRELVHVPLVLAGPGLAAGTRIDVPVSGASLGPTLARLGNASIRGLEDDRDLFRPAAGAPVLFSTRNGWWNGFHRQPLFGMRVGDRVLHLAPEGAPWGRHGQATGGEVRLYDLGLDPGEEHDLAPEQAAATAALRAELEARLERMRRGRVESPRGPDEGTLDVLRDLGYTGD